MALRPGARDRDDICILFAVEPPGAALLIAVLEGLDVVAERYAEAILAAADRLRLVRAGQAPEAAAYSYDDPELVPGRVRSRRRRPLLRVGPAGRRAGSGTASPTAG